MKVASVHYHLRPGGVTSVILNTFKAKPQGVEFLVLTGESSPDFKYPYRVIPGLQYEQKRPNLDANQLLIELKQAAKDYFGSSPDLWHFHNHSLGKNTLIPQVILKLAREKVPLLLHIHDFAEDGRPANYQLMLNTFAQGKPERLAQYLYPKAEHVHYAVLTSRDKSFLHKAGANSNQVHLLANPVEVDFTLEKRERVLPQELSSFWLYPTRAIRRKNIGEFILLAMLCPDIVLATTRGPENPFFRPIFERWKNFVQTRNLNNVLFELALKYDFVALLEKAKAIVSTSISEGFGLVFLEPWLKSKPLVGRDLPEITKDFKEKGLRLDLYHRFSFPLDWLDQQYLRAKMTQVRQKQVQAYQISPSPSDFEEVWQSFVCDQQIDFGRLDEELQQMVLDFLIKNPAQKTIFPQPRPEPKWIEHNQKIVQTEFGLSKYKTNLLTTYNQIIHSKCTDVDSLDAVVLLKEFLAPHRFNFLKVDCR